MEHAPVAGEQPLDPPDAATAQAYLDELPGVRQRREVVLDRRRLGRLYVVEGAAFAVFIGALLWTDLLRQLTGASTSSLTFSLLIVVFLWSSLSRGIRERYGARQGPRGLARVVNLVLLVAALLAAVVLFFAGSAAPAWLRIGPVLLAFVGGLWPGLALSREASGMPKLEPPLHAVMTPAGRWATLVCGLGMSVAVLLMGWITVGGPLSSTLGLISATIVIIAIVICSHLGLVTELGAMWRPPQWTAFVLSALLTGAVMVWATASPESGLTVGIAAAGVILALVLIASVWPVGSDA